MTDYTLNIVNRYLSATDSEYREGMTWYSERHAFALSLTPDDVWKGAGIIAAFSPLTPWYRNIELATTLVHNNGVMEGGTLKNSIRAAVRIFNGEHTLDVLKGDKTRAFASAIADPLHNVATIDRHAFDIAIGAIHTDDTRKIGKTIYRDLSNAYCEAADYAGIPVASMQAITWLAHRRIIDVWARNRDA
jgi:hypothetical protein